LVGKALGYAPAELAVPWYRVLRSDRRLAFAADTDSAQQQRQCLLNEGVLVKNNRVALQYIWQPDLAELLFKLQY
jgi:methylated-DNA-protein-cysteine methyltransferase related protein